MTDLDRLIAAVEAGEYHDRPSGTPRYYEFGTDSEGILPMGRLNRMEVLRSGKSGALATLRAYAATQEPTPMTPTPEEVAALVQLLQRPYGNMTGSERTDTAAALTALQARAEAAEARVRELEAASQDLRARFHSRMRGATWTMTDMQAVARLDAALTPAPADSQ